MKKYCFCMTGNQLWFDAAIKIKELGIAEPVLWLGDDRHFCNAKSAFGDAVIPMADLVHYQENIENIKYSSEHIDFFLSQNYLRAKDRCTKMMDRLDLYSTYGRLDREIVFNKLAIFYLKKLEYAKPEALIVAEMPHSHAQYLLYEICDFLDLAIFKFNTWMPVPLLFMQDVRTGQRVELDQEISSKYNRDIEHEIHNYIHAIIKRMKDDQAYELSYMKAQRQSLLFFNKVKNFFQSGARDALKEFWFQLRRNIKYDYYKINPYKLGAFGRYKIKRIRRKSLKKELVNNQRSIDLDRQYAYFALHFEPERTTNPDGGAFHDQYLAILQLRKLIPNNIDIFVKEHPSQFYMADKGSRGRSPLFYEAIHNVQGVHLIDMDIDSIDLIKNSMLVSTITGSVALEAAVMGRKSVIFGDTWFNNCPNVFAWSEDLSFDNIIKQPTKNSEDILTFLLNEKKLHAVLGCQNISAQLRYPRATKKDFLSIELEGVTNLMKKAFSEI